jgi:hypothetical protein
MFDEAAHIEIHSRCLRTSVTFSGLGASTRVSPITDISHAGNGLGVLDQDLTVQIGDSDLVAGSLRGSANPCFWRECLPLTGDRSGDLTNDGDAGDLANRADATVTTNIHPLGTCWALARSRPPCSRMHAAVSACPRLALRRIDARRARKAILPDRCPEERRAHGW